MSVDGGIGRLVAYAEKYLELSPRDAVYATNRLLDALGRTAYTAEETGEPPELPDAILREIFAALDEAGVPYDAATLGEKLMDAVCMRPSEFEARFASQMQASPAQATAWAYDYAVHSNYVKKSAVAKNLKWTAENGLEITINLSKPEKNNKDLQKQLTTVSTDYPKCTICRENEGYERAGFSRRNMRTVSLTLGGEPWFWQYSPYAYFNEHGIAVSCRHTPMKLDGGTVEKLFDFTDLFPHYFIGNNAPLPRAGGSILMHDHFQGGNAVLPMQRAGVRAKLHSAAHPSAEVSLIDWYNTALRLEGTRSEVAALAADIVAAWRTYECAEAEILPFTGETPHSTASCIARKTAKGYRLEIILRNNRTNERHPDGIFHAHREYHAIKSESIGLIEAMGLFVLPARLKRQLADVRATLAGEKSALDEGNEIFAPILEKLLARYGADAAHAEEIVKREVEETCANILGNTAVFKRDKTGDRALAEFLSQAGLEISGGTL